VAEELSVRKEPPYVNNMVLHDVSPPLRTSIKFYTELGKAFRGTKRSFVKLLYVAMCFQNSDLREVYEFLKRQSVSLGRSTSSAGA
jgi:hypothetical protein